MEDNQHKGRKNLSGRPRARKPVDMDYVYQQIDSGRRIQDVAEELGVSRSTLQSRHREYQEAARRAAEKAGEM